VLLLSRVQSAAPAVDPSGEVRLRGLKQYARLFDTLRFLGRTLTREAEVTSRNFLSDGTIRVRWSAKCSTTALATALTQALVEGDAGVVHLDGVSAYELNKRGLICAHRLESVVLSGPDLQPVSLAACGWPSLVAAWPEAAAVCSSKRCVTRCN